MRFLSRYFTQNKESIEEYFAMIAKETPTRFASVMLVMALLGYFSSLWIVLLVCAALLIDDIAILWANAGMKSPNAFPRYIIASGVNVIATFAYGLFLADIVYQADSAVASLVALLALIVSFAQIALVRAEDLLHGGTTALPLFISLAFGLGLRLNAIDNGGAETIVGWIGGVLGLGYLGWIYAETGRIRKKLRFERTRATEANLAKTRFLGALSHEIRTPLNALYGTAQLMKFNSDPDETKIRSEIILESAASLTALVDDVVDFMRLDSGTIEITPVPVDLVALVKHKIQLFQANAENKGLTLRLLPPEGIPRLGMVDRMRFEQVLGNLLSNAIKYTDRGSITVKMNYHLGLNGGLLDVSVSDTGIGMTKAEADNLFDAFGTSLRSNPSFRGGAGLGLSIANSIAHIMDGKIEVESEPHVGSTFTISCRVGDVPEELMNPQPPQHRNVPVNPTNNKRLENLEVLVVDDVEMNRIVVRKFLELEGAIVAEAVNGLDAVEKVDANNFDAVLLDQMMPVMNGKEALSKIRTLGEGTANLPVLGLSAAIYDEDREELESLGLSKFLTKPIGREELTRALCDAVGRTY